MDAFSYYIYFLCLFSFLYALTDVLRQMESARNGYTTRCTALCAAIRNPITQPIEVRSAIFFSTKRALLHSLDPSYIIVDIRRTPLSKVHTNALVKISIDRYILRQLYFVYLYTYFTG